jgi:hypothetical protein
MRDSCQPYYTHHEKTTHSYYIPIIVIIRKQLPAISIQKHFFMNFKT